MSYEHERSCCASSRKSALPGEHAAFDGVKREHVDHVVDPKPEGGICKRMGGHVNLLLDGRSPSKAISPFSQIVAESPCDQNIQDGGD